MSRELLACSAAFTHASQQPYEKVLAGPCLTGLAAEAQKLSGPPEVTGLTRHRAQSVVCYYPRDPSRCLDPRASSGRFKMCSAELLFATFGPRADKATQTVVLLQVTFCVGWQRALSPGQPLSGTQLPPSCVRHCPLKPLGSVLADSGQKGMDETRWLFNSPSQEHPTKRPWPKLFRGPSLTAKEEGKMSRHGQSGQHCPLLLPQNGTNPGPRSRGKGKVGELEQWLTPSLKEDKTHQIPARHSPSLPRICPFSPFRLRCCPWTWGLPSTPWQQGETGKIGKRVTPQPSGKSLSTWEWEGKHNFLSFGCLGRQ